MKSTDCGPKTPTCDDCVFRRELLCALAGNAICPTFRPAVGRGAFYAVPAASCPPERERPPVAA